MLSPDSKWTGEEPEWDGCEFWPVEKFMRTRMRALNFYNYYLDASHMKPIVLEWMKANKYSKTDIATIKEAGPNVLPSTVGKLIRCMNRGMLAQHPDARAYYASLPFHTVPPKPKNDLTTVKKEINAVLSMLTCSAPAKMADSIIKEKPKKPVTPLDRIKERVDKEIIPLLEECLDVWAVSRSGEKTVNMFALLRDSNIPVQGCKGICDWIDRTYAEFNGALLKTDDQLVEGYSHFAKPELRKIVKHLAAMSLDIQNHAKIKKSNRKPRIKKVKDADKQVSRFKYQQHSSDWNIDSVSPNRVPCAQRVYLFNSKTRALSVYISSGSSGFEVKGTTIKGFDADQSFIATLRKPKDLLPALLTSTPKQLDKLIAGLTVKRRAVNGRTNEQTLILKVVENKI